MLAKRGVGKWQVAMAACDENCDPSSNFSGLYDEEDASWSDMSDEWDTLTTTIRENYISSAVLRGATVVVCSEKEVVYREHFGEHGPQEIYTVASLTKIITTIACLQLVDAGKISLDDPVSKYVPSFCYARRKDPDGHENDINNPVTIRHCLNHTAGFPFLVASIHPRKLWSALERREAAKPDNSREDLVTYVNDVLAERPLMFRPGSHFNYCEGHNVVAYIIEIVSGKFFNDYVSDHITGPLGMTSTIFPQKPSLPRPRRCRCVKSCLFRLSSKLRRLALLRRKLEVNRAVVARSDVWGDVGLNGTADDWIRLNRMLLAGGILDGVRILSEDSVEAICRSSLPEGAQLAAPFAVDAPPSRPSRSSGETPKQDEAAPLIGKRRKASPRNSVQKYPFGLPKEQLKNFRRANSYPGQSFGLGMAIIEDPEQSGLHPKAAGTCWWMGYLSTFFAFNRRTGVGCLVMGKDPSCFEHQQILADVLNAVYKWSDA